MDIKVLELEESIRKTISQDNGRIAIFEYEQGTPKFKPGGIREETIYIERIVLTVSTFNEKTKEVTVMYKTDPGIDKVVCLAEVSHYLEVIKPTISPYTMTWKKKGNAEESTKSFFYCNDMVEVLDKFFATRKREEYVIFSLEMKGSE